MTGSPLPRGRLFLWACLVPFAYAPSFVLGSPPGTAETLVVVVAIALAFLAIAALFRTELPDRLEPRLGRWMPLLLAIFACLYTAFSVATASSRLAALGDYSMAGLFSQSFWTLLHGQGFANTHETLDGSLGNHFAVHFSPTLLIAAPFYRLWPHPLLLLGFQSLSIGLIPWPVYALFAPRVGRVGAALFGLAAVTMTGTTWFGSADFFDSNFLPVLLFATVWALERRRWVWFVVFALASLGVREEVGVAFALLGVYALLRGYGWKTALAISALGVVWFGLVVSVVIPRFSSPGMWMDPKRFFALMFGHWGATPPAALRAIVTHPVQLAHWLLSRENLGFLYQLLRPLLILPPFADWASLPSLPGLGVILMSSLGFMKGGHYAHIPATFLTLATLFAAARTIARAPESRRLATGLTLALVVFAGTLPALWMTSAYVPSPTPPAEVAARVVNLIPAGAPVYAPVKLYPRLCNRDEFGCWWSTYELGREPAFRGRYRFIVLWPASDPDRSRDAPLADSLAHDPRFVQRPGYDPFLVFEKR